MGFQRRLSHMAAVTKWKADQQMRLMRSQSDVRELEGKLEAEKLALADAVLAAHAEGTLHALDLLPLIGAVDELKAQIAAALVQLEAIKAEEPPEMEGVAPAVPAAPAQPVGIETQPVEVELPPAPAAVAVAAVEVGTPPAEPAVVPPPVEIGTPPVEPTRAASAVQAAPAAQPVLVCPECGRVLTGRFCPEHGLQGVPAP